jgi:hypothetical protein
VPKAGRVEQLSVLRLRPFAPGPPAQHVDVEQLGEVRLLRPRNDVFHDEDAPGPGGGGPQVPENRDALAIIPVVQDQL